MKYKYNIVDDYNIIMVYKTYCTYLRDEEVNFAIQKGLQASRAEVLYFKHNSPEDLERLILDKNVIVSYIDYNFAHVDIISDWICLEIKESFIDSYKNPRKY